MDLRNKYDKETLQRMIEEEPFDRVNVSFYKYVHLLGVEELRDRLFLEWQDLGVLGRIYIAHEGINGQVSIPEDKVAAFKKNLSQRPEFSDLKLNPAIDHRNDAFLKLTIKIRHKIVADGLDDTTFDVTNVGRHLSAEEFNKAIEEEEPVIVDMRNHYESEVGHFQGAITPEVETFREELPKVAEQLKDKKDKKVLLYCTGGIRCEKASAYLKHQGFEDVNQLKGGIISYAREIEEKNLESKFVGKNFVFDERLGERITDEVISRCHQCGKPCDHHVNCKNVSCNLLFIQCEDCAAEFEGCCTPECQEFIHLPQEEQEARRKGTRNPKRFNKGKGSANMLMERIEKYRKEKKGTDKQAG